jgi:hypothetical protein
MQIQDFVNKGYTAPDSLGRRFRPPGDELIPRPKPNEAVVFCDFFVAGLQFPLEKFVSDVLEIFVVQFPPVARLSVFSMAMKMTGCDLLADTFARFYKIQQLRNKIHDLETNEEVYSDFGAYVVVPKNIEGEGSLVSTYRNKWAQMD